LEQMSFENYFEKKKNNCFKLFIAPFHAEAFPKAPRHLSE